MNNNKWYAVMMDRDDNDWGYGSEDKAEAMRMVIDRLDTNPDSYIAVIDNDVCVEEIIPDDFDGPYYYAAQIVKAHDFDACRDDLDHLMHWLDLDEEWKQADGDSFETVIRKAGQMIGVSLI